MTPRRTLRLCSIHIAQLMTHPAIYTIPFTLQLCYKPLGILQRITKSQKFYISSHNGLQKIHNINFVWHRWQSFPEREQSSRNFCLFPSDFLRTINSAFSENRSIISWLPSIHHINICTQPWFTMKEVMQDVNQPQNWLHLATWKQSLRNIISSFTYT